MNENVNARLAGGFLAAFLLVGATAATASADDGPAVQGKVNTGIEVGGPAGISSSVSNNANVGIDTLTDLAAGVTAAMG